MVIAFEPVCRGIPVAVHAALSFEPLSEAEPLPPRSLFQRTRYRRRLSVAVPAMRALPVSTLLTASTLTVGSTPSRACQYTRWISLIFSLSIAVSEPADPAALWVCSAAFWSAPPQPEMAMSDKACATNSVVRFKRNFIPTSFDL
jgi:hypothetical protein